METPDGPRHRLTLQPERDPARAHKGGIASTNDNRQMPDWKSVPFEENMHADFS